jgi:hypothetical protein
MDAGTFIGYQVVNLILAIHTGLLALKHRLNMLELDCLAWPVSIFNCHIATQQGFYFSP